MKRTGYLVARNLSIWSLVWLCVGTFGFAAPPAEKQTETEHSEGPAAQVASAQPTSATGAMKADSSSSSLTSATGKDDEGKDAASKAPKVQNTEMLRVLEFARDGYERMTKTIRDYTCIIYRREPVDNPRDRAQYIFAKIRHEQRKDGKVVVPFSVYLRFLKPERVKGREVIYVRGRNHGDLIARRGGRHSPNMTFQLDPNSPLAMEGNRYPITEVGIKNLTKQLIGVLEKELSSGDCEVKSFRDAKLNNRPCTHFQVRHTVRRPGQRYYMARVLVDDELKIPVYFASYDWPKTKGGKPRLLEEYAYLNIKINVGLTDKDFDIKNPEYHFKQLEPPSDDASLESADDVADDTAKDADKDADKQAQETLSSPVDLQPPAAKAEQSAKENKSDER